VPADLLVKANSLVLSSERSMELLGYALAGLIAATISWIPLFLIDAGTYLFSAVTLLGIPDALHKTRTLAPRILQDVRDGMRFVLSSRVLRSTMALSAAFALFAGLTYPTLVFLTYRALHAGAFGYGVLEAVIGAGAVIGALTAPRLMARNKAGMLILGAVGACGLSYAFTGFTSNLFFAIGFLFLGGIASTIYFVPLISVLQREAPDNLRGRVMSTRLLLSQSGLLAGMAIAGPLTDRVGAALVFVTAGLLLVVAAVLGLAFNDLRNASLREPEARVLQAAG
jgi:predicted MFS family arabinose efflux permease